MSKEILIEGYTAEEILAFSEEELRNFVFTDGPLVFRIGSAEILGELRHDEKTLTMELAHIDGGGEGVLPTLWLMAEKYARQQGLKNVEWIVHAINCAKPNPKLRRMLDRLGFVVLDVPQIGEAYYLLRDIEGA